MKTLILVHAYPGIDDLLARHWPYYKLAGCDIVGIGRTDGIIKWPEPVLYLNIGRNSYVDGANLPSRVVETFAEALKRPEYTDFCIIEADSIFCRPLPPHPGGFVTHLACGWSEGFKGHQCFHPMWWADRATAEKIVEYGRNMIARGDIEQGFPDRFVGWMFEQFGMKWKQAQSYSRNALDQPQYVQQAINAIRSGAYFIHGVKTAAQLEPLAQAIRTEEALFAPI